jgi:hypothetical protein
MRCALVLVAACSVGTYDPLEHVDYREYPDAASAVRAILTDTGPAHVYAIGEYHPTAAVSTMPLARFTREVLPVLAPHAEDLVVEAWFDARCVPSHDPVADQIREVTRRPPQQQVDLDALLDRMHTHALPMTCIEQASMLDANGRVDFYRLLQTIAQKLAETTRRLLADGHDVIVYGGALHNDLYPPWPLDELAYGHVLARDTDVVELDLVVPEVAAPMRMLWHEPWFPLVSELPHDRARVWERGKNSYVIVLPADAGHVAPVM